MTGSNKSIFLRNARAVLPDHVSEKTDLLIEDGFIRRVYSHRDQLSEFSRNVSGSSEIDLEGLTLYPGFIDVHIHGAVGVDTMNADAQELERVSEFLATQGVTGWLPTLVPGPDTDYARAVAAITAAMHEESAAPGARVLGVHYEGPFVNSAQCGALHTDYFKAYSGPECLAELPLPSAGNAVKMITVAPEIEGGIELVRELARRGWVVSVGHTRASFDLLEEVFEAGGRHMTHFMNAMAPLNHRAPGPVAWGLARDEVTCDVIADGIHLDRQMLRLLCKLKGANRLTLISDSIAAAGRGDGDYQIWGETISVRDGRTSNAHGSIAGSVITMLDAVRLMGSLDVSEVDLAQMAATNPASLLGLDGDCGTIEKGKRADLVALNPKGEVALTLVGGEVAFKR
ncbi:MAG TPA: N-acetylglucosamine-6-phosphate deacetylase [Pyrinomonadaceae bacterium]|nr:N-acetylglucosamine-6-phosphate deacetylase [Pyrinomonadaceae bacterium]